VGADGVAYDSDYNVRMKVGRDRGLATHRSALILVCVAVVVGCGDDQVAGDAGSPDATFTDTASDGPANGEAGDAPSSGLDAGACVHGGGPCGAASDCCSGACTAHQCACTSDNEACTAGSQCCGGVCGANGTCTPLDTSCKTLGNACTTDSSCCSSLCIGGVCAASSFCEQLGDVCSSASECCGGLCNVTKGPFGLCGTPFNDFPCGVEGAVCALRDAGTPACGGTCCGRQCAPYPPTGVSICQRASGCRPTADLCVSDDDCCGADLGVAVCVKSGTDPIGSCSNPTLCKPNGAICRTATPQCNATENCCSGDTLSNPTCNPDNTGRARCSNAQCVGPGQACGSSADCCNVWPCVRNAAAADAGADSGLPTFVCYSASCVPSCGPCTNDKDCCGQSCTLSIGSTNGVCAPCNHS